MKVSTSHFGAQEVDPESVITFPNGIAGFESSKRFKLFHEEGKPTVFWLQSLDDAELTLSVAPAELFDIYYQMELTDEESALLRLSGPEELAVLVILSKDEGADEVQNASGTRLRGNLHGPLLLNMAQRIGFQKVITRLSQAVLLRAEA